MMAATKYLYATPRAAEEMPALAQQSKAAALEQVGLAAVRWIDTHDAEDLNALRYAACVFRTYESVCRELAVTR